MEEAPFLEALLEELFAAPPDDVLFLAAPFEEAPLEEVPFLAAPLVEALEAPLEDAPFLAAPLEDAPFDELLLAPLELDFAAPLEEVLLAAFFAVAMLFEF
ncbi:MAG TPA: hypothetical protein VEY10_04525 [Flavisolibacter sp.]|nr:hypothetical protein [Flavisolibacter sp.]